MRFHAVMLLLVVGLGAVMAGASLAIDWTAWRPATCLPDACFCEAIGAGPIRQPINTWSNLAFVWVGAWVLSGLRLRQAPRHGLRFQSKADSENTLKRVSTRFAYQPSNSFDGAFDGAAKLFGGACIAIGLGSWFYHASLTFVGQWLDVMSMYLLGTFMVLSATERILSGARRSRRMPITVRSFAVYYTVINVAWGVLLIVWPEARRYVFGGLIATALMLEAILHRRKQTTLQAKWLIAALGVYVVAQVIWTLDLNHLVCDPTSVLQGHAVWHGLTALSAGLVYVYYQSAGQRPS